MGDAAVMFLLAILPPLLATIAPPMGGVGAVGAVGSPGPDWLTSGGGLAQAAGADQRYHTEPQIERRSHRTRRAVSIALKTVFSWAKGFMCRALYTAGPRDRQLRRQGQVSYNMACRKGCQLELERVVFNDTVDELRAMEHCDRLNQSWPLVGKVCSQCVEKVKGTVGHCRIGYQWEMCMLHGPKDFPPAGDRGETTAKPAEHPVSESEPERNTENHREPERTTAAVTESGESGSEPERLAAAYTIDL